VDRSLAQTGISFIDVFLAPYRTRVQLLRHLSQVQILRGSNNKNILVFKINKDRTREYNLKKKDKNRITDFFFCPRLQYSSRKIKNTVINPLFKIWIFCSL
jgi:hypothetical protein